ncbi:hypothetical protein BJ322DRAFT_1109247 [Thelephora terrestris]|uniref:Uncharacterized protein n=1 Tax=Thelephora terrestris TaxID=56493 RepID=A0A9P6HDF4_9AGAM|nr:hypothetical protein BJ322DRAFT_1109247 [Thelephora terrestris]
MPVSSRVARPSSHALDNEDHALSGSPPPRDWSSPFDQGDLDLNDSLEYEPRAACVSGPTGSHRSHPYDSRARCDPKSRGHGSHSGKSRISVPAKKYHSQSSSPVDNDNPNLIELMDLRAKCARLQREVHDAHLLGKSSLEYEQMLEGLRDAIYDMKDDVQKIAEHIAANYTGEIPGIRTFGIPLNPKQVDYKRVKFWPRSVWQEIRNGAKLKESRALDSRPPPVLTLFFEDEFGVPVLADVKEEVQGDLTTYWVDMLQNSKLPMHYSGLGLNRQEDFRKTMEEKYPWLRLCEGHWKVRQIWVNYYRKSRILAIIENDPTLKKKFTAILPDPADILEISSDTEGSQPTGNQKKKKVVLVISSEAEDGSPAPGNTTNEAPVRASNPTINLEPMESSGPSTGSKRGRPESDDMRPASPKKSKGKGKATAMTTDFHPPKAQPKKNTAKIGKTDIFSKVKVTQPAPKALPVQNPPVVSGTSAVDPQPPRPSTPQNPPVASGSCAVQPSPPRSATPEQTLCWPSYSLSRSLYPDKGHAQGPSQFEPNPQFFVGSPPPPVITPIIATLAPSNNGNTNGDSDSLTAPSVSPEPVATPTKKRTGAKGRFPWRQLWLGEWLAISGNTKAGFNAYLKEITDKAKAAKINELKSRY